LSLLLLLLIPRQGVGLYQSRILRQKQQNAIGRRGCGAARRRDQYRHWLSWLPGTAAPGRQAGRADRRTDRSRRIASVAALCPRACVCVCVMSCGCVTANWNVVNTSFKLSVVLLDAFAMLLNDNNVNNKQLQTRTLAQKRFCN